MSETTSDAFVLYGAFGDLAKKKIFPALSAIAKRDGLGIPVIAVARGARTLNLLKETARESIEQNGDGADDEASFKLLALLRFVNGDYKDDDTFTRLRQAMGDAAHPIHYLAIPPEMFEAVVERLGRSGCAEGARIIVEKPYGTDLEDGL
jgi:glucose-6-phosphate 1-dehydrogenase